MLTDAQMNKILYYLKQCYEEINEKDFIVEDNFIFLPNIEFFRNKEGQWIPS